jgi:hypothetical protein
MRHGANTSQVHDWRPLKCSARSSERCSLATRLQVSVVASTTHGLARAEPYLCDLLDRSFMFVSPTRRLACPVCSSATTSSTASQTVGEHAW